MAQYESRYLRLGFYVDGELRQFNNGRYQTSDKKEMAVLDGMSDVTRIDEPKAEVAKEAPAPKRPARKASAK